MKTLLTLLSAVVFLSTSVSGQYSTTIYAKFGVLNQLNSDHIQQSFFSTNSPWSAEVSESVSSDEFEYAQSLALGMEWNLNKFKIGFRNQIQSHSFSKQLTNADESEVTAFNFTSNAIDQALTLGFELFNTAKSGSNMGVSLVPRTVLGIARRRTFAEQEITSSSTRNIEKRTIKLATGYADFELELNFQVSQKVKITATPGYQYMDFRNESFGFTNPVDNIDMGLPYTSSYKPRPNYSALYFNAGIAVTI
jgi:hypothetical protein